ncbi:hypothetical protein [Thiolapillus sp.]
MTDLQKMEIERYRGEMVENIRELVDKYLSISNWDIPEIDEQKTMAYILQVFREALDDLEEEWKTKKAP